MEKLAITFAEFMIDQKYTAEFLSHISDLENRESLKKETRKSLEQGYMIDRKGMKYYWNNIRHKNPAGDDYIQVYETKEDWIAHEQALIRDVEEEILQIKGEIRGYWNEYMKYTELENLDMKKEMRAFAKVAKKRSKVIELLIKEIGECEHCPLENICTQKYRESHFLRRCPDEWFQFLNSKDMVTFYEPKILW